jgi:hypothetical protein
MYGSTDMYGSTEKWHIGFAASREYPVTRWEHGGCFWQAAAGGQILTVRPRIQQKNRIVVKRITR